MSDEMPSKIDSKTVFLKEEEKLVDCAYEEIDNLESKDSLIRVIQNLADNRLKSRNILAVDDSNNTLQEITKVVSKSLTTGKVRILKEEEALLDRDRKQSDFDQLTVDLHLDPVSIKEMHNRWSAEAGLVENIDHIIRECRESRQLVASLEEVKMEEQELLEAKATPLRNRLMKHVMPTLTRALIDCVKVRPEDAIDVIMSQEEEEVEDISPLQSQLLFSQPLTDTQTSDFEAAPVDQISSPLLHESENLTRSLSQSSHEVQAEQVDNQKNRSQTKLDKQPFSGMISLTATLSFLILCGLCLSVSDAQQCKADQKTCSTDGPARLDICQPHRTTAELFKITSVGTEIFTSGVCRCRLSNLMANGGFGIVVNNFSCPVNGCPWRLQIIVNGCLKAQFCCTDIWKGYEILYFQPTDHVTSVSLQIAQLAEPPEEFGTVSVAIRFDGHKRRLAQMTCGITTFGKSLKKCAPMPELKHAPESFVPVRQQENMMVLDICKPACSSQNPMTFGMNVGALHGPLVCSSKVSAVVSPNVFKVTISEFVCLNRCSYQLMIIIGPCIVQTFCCNIEWQPLTKMIENVNNEAVVQVSKSVDEPEALTFSLTILVGDGTARPVSMASFQSGYTNTSTAAFCHLLTGSTAASTFRQTKAEETVSQNTSGPFDGAVTDDRSAEGQRANVASGMSGGTPVPLEQRLWSVIFLRILQLIAFSGGGGSALRLIKKLIHAFGIDQNGPMQNTLAAAMNHYVTNNPGSLIDKAFRSMQSVAANGYGVVKGIIIFLCGGFVCVYLFNLATASAAFIASKFGWW